MGQGLFSSTQFRNVLFLGAVFLGSQASAKESSPLDLLRAVCKPGNIVIKKKSAPSCRACPFSKARGNFTISKTYEGAFTAKGKEEKLVLLAAPECHEDGFALLVKSGKRWKEEQRVREKLSGECVPIKVADEPVRLLCVEEKKDDVSTQRSLAVVEFLGGKKKTTTLLELNDNLATECPPDQYGTGYFTSYRHDVGENVIHAHVVTKTYAKKVIKKEDCEVGASKGVEEYDLEYVWVNGRYAISPAAKPREDALREHSALFGPKPRE